jgi:hypothetical protein
VQCDLLDPRLVQPYRFSTEAFVAARSFGRVVGLVDPSEAYGIENGGGIFFRDIVGRVAPSLTIVHKHGYKWMRLHIAVDPNCRYGLVQDFNYVLRIARDVQLKWTILRLVLTIIQSESYRYAYDENALSHAVQIEDHGKLPSH